MTILEKIKEAMDELDEASAREIKDFIINKYGPISETGYSADIISAAVNHTSRGHYHQSKKERIANNPKYDFLFQTDQKKFAPYDPEKHGVWEMREEADGRFMPHKLPEGTPLPPFTCEVTIQGQQFTFTNKDLEAAFNATVEGDWLNVPGKEAYTHVFVSGNSKPVKAVFRNLRGVPEGFRFTTHEAKRVMKQLGFRVVDTREKTARLCLVGTWKDVLTDFDSVQEVIKRKGGWAAWWSFPIDKSAQSLLKKPFYIYLNVGGGSLPCRMKVEDYVTQQGSEGIESPWQELTNENSRGKTRAGNKSSQVFKTWLKVSSIEKLDPPLSVYDMTFADGLSDAGNVLNQVRFGYVYDDFSSRAKVNYWWVNQGDNYSHEREGEYIFAPLQDQRGVQPSHWANVTKVQPGDQILHYAKGALRAISRAEERPYEGLRPSGRPEGQQGNIVDLEYTELPEPILLEKISQEFRIEENGPFDVNGSVKQGYLFPLSLSFVSKIKPMIGVDAYFAELVMEDLVATYGMSEDLPKNLILFGPPGTGKTHRLKSEYFDVFTDKVSGVERYVFTTFHQSYSYEEFVEGIKPVLVDDPHSFVGDVAYEIKPGVFKEIVDKAKADPQHPYAIFIDEISRGNVASIFGELITLIEDDKREGGANELKATLPYSRDEFVVPSNLHIIGTMNTADRSVVALDTALRRRFSFIEMMPDVKAIDQPANFKIDLKNLLDTINGRIEKLLDRDHVIGHSYFMGVAKAADPFRELQHCFANKVLPLLQEYFYGDPAKVGMVLGKEFVQLVDNGVSFAEGAWEEDGWEERPVYRFSDPNKMTDDQFVSIYEA